MLVFPNYAFYLKIVLLQNMVNKSKSTLTLIISVSLLTWHSGILEYYCVMKQCPLESMTKNPSASDNQRLIWELELIRSCNGIFVVSHVPLPMFYPLIVCKKWLSPIISLKKLLNFALIGWYRWSHFGVISTMELAVPKHLSRAQ